MGAAGGASARPGDRSPGGLNRDRRRPASAHGHERGVPIVVYAGASGPVSGPPARAFRADAP